MFSGTSMRLGCTWSRFARTVVPFIGAFIRPFWAGKSLLLTTLTDRKKAAYTEHDAQREHWGANRFYRRTLFYI
jgi:hypothetical protein